MLISDKDHARDFNDDFNEAVEEALHHPMPAVIAARRQHIADLASCVHCRWPAKLCQNLNALYAKRNPADPAGVADLCGGRPGFCHHIEDPKLLHQLMDEIAAGHVRTVAEVDPPPVLGPQPVSRAWLLAQDVWWYPHRKPATRIEGMAKTHLLNTVNFLERRAGVAMRMISFAHAPDDVMGDFLREREDPVAWLRRQPLLKAMYRHLPKRDTKRWHALAVRAAHWSTCPMRKAHPGRGDSCLCIRRGGRTVGASNDSAVTA